MGRIPRTVWMLGAVSFFTDLSSESKLADLRGRRSIIASGWLYYAAIYGAFAYVESQAAVIATFLLYGIYFGMVEPSEKAMVADLVPRRLRGTAFGYYHFTIGLGALPASLIFGMVWQTFGASAAFLMGAALAGAAAGLLFLVQPTEVVQ